MKQTNDKFFLDSYIILYSLDADRVKKKISESLLKSFPVISPQVVFECLNVVIKKFKFSKTDALDFSKILIKYSSIQEETKEVMSDALVLFHSYSPQVFDSKIIASGLHAGCSILYSEDMQNGIVIENRLTIINPFL